MRFSRLTILPFFIFLLLYSIKVNAQVGHVLSGVLKDSLGNAIVGLEINLNSNNDTLITHSDLEGKFIFNLLKSKNITLLIHGTRYESLIIKCQFDKQNPNINLHSIVLKGLVIHLNEIVIKEKPIAVLLKQDTTEFNAAAYPLYKYDMLEDLLKRLPGIQIDADGKTFYMGKQINKLRINGKDFFSGNLIEFLNQLPAEIISKLQVIDDYGDEANFTGIKTGESAKILNLVTKPGINSGKFGNITTTLGTNKQYGVTENTNYWEDSKQISLGANLNKTENTVGTVNTNSITASYRDIFKGSLTFSGNYNYTNNANNVNINTFSQSVIDSLLINNKINNYSKGNNFSHNFNFDLRNRSDGDNFWTISPVISFVNNNNNSETISSQSGGIRQNLNQKSLSTSYSTFLSGSFNFMHKFSKKGRNFSISLEEGNNKNKNDLFDTLNYYDVNNNPLKDSLFNRLINDRIRENSMFAKVIYSEPIFKNSHVDLLFSMNEKVQTNDAIAYEAISTGYERIDSASNFFKSNFRVFQLNLDYRYNSKNVRFISGTGFQQTNLNGTGQDLLPIPNQNFDAFNIIPFLNISYILSSRNTLGLNYISSYLPPTNDQLNPSANIGNVQNVVIGNPDLSPTFSHRFNVDISHSGLLGSVFNLNIGTSIEKNKVVTNTILLSDSLNNLKQETHYLNANGFYSINIGDYYSFPFIKINNAEYNLTFLGNMSLNHNIYFTDYVKSISQNLNLNQSVSFSFKLNQWGFNISSGYSQIGNQVTDGTGINTTLKTFKISINTDFVITTNLNASVNTIKNFNWGEANDLSSNPLILNLSVKQVLFKNKSGTLQFGAFDLFNQSNVLIRTVTANSVIDSRTNYITRYFKLSFSIRLSKFGSN